MFDYLPNLIEVSFYTKIIYSTVKSLVILPQTRTGPEHEDDEAVAGDADGPDTDGVAHQRELVEDGVWKNRHRHQRLDKIFPDSL